MVLGNGFDLACGLPTSYNEFFGWRFKEIECVGIEEKIVAYYEWFNAPVTHITFVGNTEVDPLRTEEIVIGKDKKTYREVYEKITDDIKGFIQQNVNYFDVYFLMNRKEKSDWNNVESEILSIVNRVSEYDAKNIESTIRNMIPGKNGYKKNGNTGINTINKLLLTIYLKECNSDKNCNIYEVLMEELKKFETNFRRYISTISEEIKDKERYRNIYTENYKKIAECNSGTYVINFNYTSITNFIQKQQYMPSEINVHGRYDKITIFGIDQNECHLDTDQYLFSKTYRKIAENTDTLELPEIKERSYERQELIFYGHSLSKADYSYFQSLFDLYDIYKQTYLSFKYSVYDEDKRYEIKKKVFYDVTKLLLDYGKTMDNEAHGKNLLHKVLLEGRLKIEEVSLEKMNFSIV